MRRPLSAFVAAFLAATLSSAALLPSARADPAASSDPWFGPDKALHFGASAAIAGGGYGLSALFTDEMAGRIAFGAGLAVGAGIAKEAFDAAGFGTPSLRDFTWGLFGTAAGIGISITIDLAFASSSKPSKAR